MDHRYDLLVKKGLKHYLEYNKVSHDMKEVLIIISELKDIVDDKNLCNMLIRILLNGSNVGVKVLMFSCYDSSDFDYQRFNDLVAVYNEFNEINVLNKLKLSQIN